jgi:2-polyprenyl-3-methyl-5-hydroxy-6-metoxy-1,4-benzoquinol methylase
MSAPTAGAAVYWERRARLFAARGEGLAAVCSYGMPQFYNRMIQLTQRLALAPHLQVLPGQRVLDVGCGVGRWSRLLARRGAKVTALDLSPTMVAIARQRATAEGLQDRCRFIVQDLAALSPPEGGARGQYDLVLAVTVLQHIIEPLQLERALRGMADRLAPGGRMVLLEAAPLRDTRRCDSAIFTARPRAEYLELFEACGLRLRSLRGVDPAPFKIWVLPHLRRLPRAVGLAGLALVSALSLPIDALFGRRAVRRSWHTVFVLEHAPADARTPAPAAQPRPVPAQRELHGA